MKIVLAIPCLLPGGTEFQTLQLARVLCDAGHEVLVYCYFEHDLSMVARFEETGARVELLRLSRSTSLLCLLGELQKKFAKARPDVVHVQYMAPGFLPVLAAKRASVGRIFATVHQPSTPYGWKARMLLRLAAMMCERFICVSEACAKSWFGDNTTATTIHNAVDIVRMDGIAAADEGVAIGVVSRLRYEKGVDVLIEAVTMLPEVRLLVVGDGPDRAMLEKRAPTNVVWAGHQPWEQAVALMKTMKIVVVPSRFEGFGLTAAEAMVAGKTVVASDVDGLREVVADAGVLVPAGDAVALAVALKRLLANPEERAVLGRKARERAERMFSLETFRDRVLECYR